MLESLFLNKAAGLRPTTLLKKSLWHRCFPANFVKFLRTPFYTEHLWWLLLIKLSRSSNIFAFTTQYWFPFLSFSFFCLLVFFCSCNDTAFKFCIKVAIIKVHAKTKISVYGLINYFHISLQLVDFSYYPRVFSKK